MSYKIQLSTEETYILADKMQEIKNKKLSRRLLAISLRHFGYQIKEISLIVGTSEKTVTNWMKLFLEGGFDALLTLRYQKDKGSKLAPYKSQIEQYFSKHPKAKLADLQAWLQTEYELKVEYSWLYRYLELHRLGPYAD
ncbi:MAG: helix-turn-helix domain-containing protein [Bacteroidota bacterium]